jgi:glycosyltransferase involved in cell wall biosynthesis
MKISVAIASFNEGPDLEATLAMLLAGKDKPDEIVIVDDSSIVPVAPRARKISKDIRVITNQIQAGAGPAKQAAVEACDGDLVVVMDAHLRPPWDWIELWRRDIDAKGDGVYCPACLGFESESGFFGVGGEIVEAPHDHQAHWKALWKVHEARPNRTPLKVAAPIGGCYAFTRRALTELGGYCPLLIGYGFEEEWIGLRAFLAGIDVWACPAVRIPHNFQRKNPRTPKVQGPDRHFAMEYNSHVAGSTLFDSSTYSRIAKTKPISSECRELLVANSDLIGGFRQFIQRRRVVSDADFQTLCLP